MAADQLFVFNASACSKRCRASGSRALRCNATPQLSRKMEYHFPSRRTCWAGTGSRQKRRHNFSPIFIQNDGRGESGWLTCSIFFRQGVVVYADHHYVAAAIAFAELAEQVLQEVFAVFAFGYDPDFSAKPAGSELKRLFHEIALLSSRLGFRHCERLPEPERTSYGNEQQQRRTVVENCGDAEPGCQVAGEQQRDALGYRDERHGTAAHAPAHFGGDLPLQQSHGGDRQQRCADADTNAAGQRSRAVWYPRDGGYAEVPCRSSRYPRASRCCSPATWHPGSASPQFSTAVRRCCRSFPPLGRSGSASRTAQH